MSGWCADGSNHGSFSGAQACSCTDAFERAVEIVQSFSSKNLLML